MSENNNDEGRTFKDCCKEAKKRMKSGYWREFDNNLQKKVEKARRMGENPTQVEQYFVDCAIKDITKGHSADDAFYLKVKKMLDMYDEVSDAIGRLIDHEIYDALPYERKQRYTLELSNKYLEALERYRKDKHFRDL